MSISQPLARVEAIVDPYNRGHDRYQAYYRQSLAAWCAACNVPFVETGSRFPNQLRLLNRVRASGRFQQMLPGGTGPALTDMLARLLGGRRGPEYYQGTYVFHSADGEVRVTVDAADSGEILAPELLRSSGVYFKTNYWPGRAYPSKVLPLPNLNPGVLPHLAELRAYRNSEKEWDLFGFFRVWGGTDELEGVEHNLALFETLARVKCRKKLLAYLVAGDIPTAAARLEKAGVPWTTTWVPQAEVWRLAARSRLNIVRHGMHQCIPWRMTEMLAMGGCPVLDYRATTRWHVPLEENVHYLNLGVPYVDSKGQAFNAEAVVERVQGWLEDGDLIPCVERYTARYFDEHLMPEKLGRYMIEASGVCGA